MTNKKTAVPAPASPAGDIAMTPDLLRQWRKKHGWKQKEAAEHLGLKKRMIQYYEKGDREGKPVEIPRTVRLACYALAQGIGDFDGEHTAPLSAPAPADAAAAPATADAAPEAIQQEPAATPPRAKKRPAKTAVAPGS